MRHLVQQKNCSERRACRIVRLPRATVRYTAKPRTDTALVERLTQIANKHPRFGYRRAWASLRRQGEFFSCVNHKRVHRLWKRHGLSVKVKTKCKRVDLPKQERPHSTDKPNHIWCVDFVQDATVTGRTLRMLTVTDECTRQSLAIHVGLSVTAQTVASVLEQVIAKCGAPAYLRSDNGPEFVALALRGFLHRSGVQTAYIDKGSPWQNGFAESFHSRFRDEFLNGEVFLSLIDAQVRVEQWRRWYNTERPHSSLGYQTPNEFADAWSAKAEQKAARTNVASGT